MKNAIRTYASAFAFFAVIAAAIGAIATLIYWLVSENFPRWLIVWARSVPETAGWLLAAALMLVTLLVIIKIVYDIVTTIRSASEEEAAHEE